MDPATLYAEYLKVWGKDFGGDAAASTYAASIFSAMSAAADAGIFVLGEDNKYYPAGSQPTNYNPVPVPGQPGSVTYVPAPPAAGATNGTTHTGSPSPTNGAAPTGDGGGLFGLSPAATLAIALGVLYLFSRK